MKIFDFFFNSSLGTVTVALSQMPLDFTTRTPVSTSVKKNIVFHSYFLENSENFLNFTKILNKFGEFSYFLEFSKIFQDTFCLF